MTTNTRGTPCRLILRISFKRSTRHFSCFEEQSFFASSADSGFVKVRSPETEACGDKLSFFSDFQFLVFLQSLKCRYLVGISWARVFWHKTHLGQQLQRRSFGLGLPSRGLLYPVAMDMTCWGGFLSANKASP